MTNSNVDVRKIALYGGAFDPPHIGHIAFCKELCSQEEFHEVWVLPSFKHPFDKALSPFEIRIEMCKVAFEEISPKVVISRKNFQFPETATQLTC